MPQAIVAAINFVVSVGIQTAAYLGASTATINAMTTLTAFVIGATVVTAAAMGASKLMQSLYEMPSMDTDASRQRTVRGTIEPMKIIYGEALVSGPIAFVGTRGEKNRDLYHAIVLAGHECESITDVYFDNEKIQNSQINSGAASGGNVTAGTFGTIGADVVCKINKHLGDQTAPDADLDAAFLAIGSNHIGTGLTYIVTKWTLIKKSQELWEKYNPQDIKALVKGRKVYDPRQDDTSDLYDDTVGVSTQRADDSSTWEWSDNPVWCLVDYLTNTDFGMSISLSKIDLEYAATAADACDVVVNIPDGTEKRFACNGVIFGIDTHKANVNKILSAMNGMITYRNGKYIIRAGAYESPTVSLNESHLQGAVSVKTSAERSDRFNTVTGVYIDPEQNHKSVEFPAITTSDALLRDNGEVLTKEVKLPMTNSKYMAQRVAFKLVKQSDLQTIVTFPANLAALQVSVGDRVNLTIDELGWTNKIFMCIGWTFSDSGNGGVNLLLREDESTAYADPDPDAGEYLSPAALATLENSFYEMPAPTDLVATGGIQNITIEWENPELSVIKYVEIYASPTSAWSGAVLIGTTQGTQFVHGGANRVDPITTGDTRYYWVRARGYDVGEDASSRSDRFPDSDTSGIFNTVGSVPTAPTTLAVLGNNIWGFNFGSTSTGSVTSNSAQLTVSGGTAPYTYAWTRISVNSGTNDVAADNATSATTTFTNPNVSMNVVSNSTWQVTVTDDVSATATATMNVSLSWLDENLTL